MTQETYDLKSSNPSTCVLMWYSNVQLHASFCWPHNSGNHPVLNDPVPQILQEPHLLVFVVYPFHSMHEYIQKLCIVNSKVLNIVCRFWNSIWSWSFAIMGHWWGNWEMKLSSKKRAVLVEMAHQSVKKNLHGNNLELMKWYTLKLYFVIKKWMKQKRIMEWIMQ